MLFPNSVPEAYLRFYLPSISQVLALQVCTPITQQYLLLKDYKHLQAAMLVGALS